MKGKLRRIYGHPQTLMAPNYPKAITYYKSIASQVFKEIPTCRLNAQIQNYSLAFWFFMKVTVFGVDAK